jgi:phage shock protein PspC (stress-responsive transcriptional regulator)
MEKRLYKDPHNKIIGGVCSGLAEYFDMDPTIVRLIFAFAFFTWGVGFGLYIVLWIVLPRKTYGPFTTPSDPTTVNYVVPPVPPVNPGSPVPPSQPFAPFPPKRQNNTGGIIVGFILILIGAMALLHQYDIFFFWHLHYLRHFFLPVILVVFGIALIIKGQQKRPWEHTGWHETVNKPDTEAPAEEASTTNPTTEV